MSSKNHDDFMTVWKKSGKNAARYLFPDNLLNLRLKQMDLKWSLIWNPRDPYFHERSSKGVLQRERMSR